MAAESSSEWQRCWNEGKKPGCGDDSDRTEAERDFGRVVHSGAFRRLQGKSQVVHTGHPDYFRTRLTHTLEVSQIARALAKRLKCHELVLVETASLIHDLGHPPFGHNGETALKKWMEHRGSFEANAQSFRIVAHLEVKFPRKRFEDAGNHQLTLGPRTRVGLNLSREVLRASFKYPWPCSKVHPVKFGYYKDEPEAEIAKWVLGGEEVALHPIAQIVEFADDIAYSVHDLEDGIRSRMIPIDLLVRDVHEREKLVDYRLDHRSDDHGTHTGETEDRGELRRKMLASLDKLLLKSGLFAHFTNPYRHVDDERGYIKEMTSGLIERFVCDVKASSSPPVSATDVTMTTDRETEIDLLKAMNWLYVIESQALQTLQYRERRIITELGDTLLGDPKLLPIEQRDAAQGATSDCQARIVCDFIAGMTDRFAQSFHARLFGTESQLVTDML